MCRCARCCDMSCEVIHHLGLLFKQTFGCKFRQSSEREFKLHLNVSVNFLCFVAFLIFVQYFCADDRKHPDNKMKQCTDEEETLMGCNH